MDSLNQELPDYEPSDMFNNRMPVAGRRITEPQEEEIDVHWIIDAFIDEINKIGSKTYVLISYHENLGDAYSQIKKLNLEISDEFTHIYDQDKQTMRQEDLFVGMVIDVLVSSRFGEGTIPDGRAYQIIIVTSPLNRDSTTGSIVQVNPANDYLLVAPAYAPREIVRINIVPDTVILNANGRSQQLYQLMPHMKIIIEHNDYFTSSIPPQTRGNLIKII